MINKELLLNIARNKGLMSKDHIEKNYFQDIFLSALFKKTNRLVFKGGTALYKLYNLPRFSEDLDFSLLEKTDVNEIINKVIKGIENFKIKSVKETKESFLVKIVCKGILTDYNTLRVDISLKNKVLDGYDIKTYVPAYIDIHPFSMKVLKLEEIIAEKIHALLAREKARDLYDLFFLLRISHFNKQLINDKLGIFGMKMSISLLQKRINNISYIWDKELRPFIFGELTEYNVVKQFVIGKIKEAIKK